MAVTSAAAEIKRELRMLGMFRESLFVGERSDRSGVRISDMAEPYIAFVSMDFSNEAVRMDYSELISSALSDLGYNHIVRNSGNILVERRADHVAAS